MIIDSHAHYACNSFKGQFRYLTHDTENYVLAEGDLECLLQALDEADIRHCIEPGISLASNTEILALCKKYPQRFFPVIGVHPTRCIYEKWRDRRMLPSLARAEGVIAIGETGLDYHHPRKEQRRIRQIGWFLYQLNLARRLKMPLVLHIRNADRQAIGILKRHPARKNGGVVHCFGGGWDIAQEYLNMGFHLGIGGALLQPEERSAPLWEAVRKMPLERILIETDAPYVMPYCKDTFEPKQLRRTRNTSLILPQVLAKIAELKDLPVEEVRKAVNSNVIRLFSLPVSEE